MTSSPLPQISPGFFNIPFSGPLPQDVETFINQKAAQMEHMRPADRHQYLGYVHRDALSAVQWRPSLLGVKGPATPGDRRRRAERAICVLCSRISRRVSQKFTSHAIEEKNNG